MARLDIFWSFRSPYSYMAIDRLAAIVRGYEIEAAFRPVRPLAMREPDFFSRGRPQFLPYLFRDVTRECARLRIVFAPPRPDPIRMDMMTGKVDAEQPLMDRLMRLAIAAEDAKKGLAFAQKVARRIWGGTENWHEEENLAAAAEEAGLVLDALEDWAEKHREKTERTIASNEADQFVHHWGVPLMVFDGEPFFGQDRLDSLRWRLDTLGLARD